MKPEYEVIYDREVKEFCLHTSYVTVYGRPISTYIRGLISECEQLADQRIKEIENRSQVTLRPEKLIDLFSNFGGNLGYTGTALVGVQDAILAAQKPKPEPVDVPFDFERWNRGGWQAMLNGHIPVYFIEANREYTMRCKK
jgi:hypothetical protein